MYSCQVHTQKKMNCQYFTLLNGLTYFLLFAYINIKYNLLHHRFLGQNIIKVNCEFHDFENTVY